MGLTSMSQSYFSEADVHHKERPVGDNLHVRSSLQRPFSCSMCSVT